MYRSIDIISNNVRAYLGAPLLVLLLWLSSCDEAEPKPTIEDPENTPTMTSTNRTIVYSGNGYKRFRMHAPEIQLFDLAERPHALYPKGILVETFRDSTADEISSDLIADYAIYYTEEKLWEARGNVVGNNYLDDRSFHSERIFWQEDDERIYSDTTTVVRDGRSITRGLNFETDQDFETWTFNRASGILAVEQAPSDSTAVSDSSAMEQTLTPVDDSTEGAIESAD